MEPSSKYLLVLDIDDTQIVDRNYLRKHGDVIPEQELIAMAQLKNKLNDLASNGQAIVVFATNGIIEHYATVKEQLATPHYISTNASTMLYDADRNTGEIKLDETHAEHIRSGGYDAQQAFEMGEAYDEMEALSEEHQSDIKVSFQFKEGITPERMEAITQELQKSVNELGLDTSVHLVEGKGEFFIDFLPTACEKGTNVEWIARRENIPFENIIVFGNGTNDISMFRQDFNGVAVGNSVEELKSHVRALTNTSGTDHIVALGERAQSVLNGLSHFKLT